MRRAKGAGTVEKIGNKYRARKTFDGIRVVGPMRDTRLEADRDLPTLKPITNKQAEMPTLAEFAESCLLGRFAKGAKAHRRSTWETNEIIWRKRIAPSKLGAMRLDQIKKRDVQAFVDAQTGISRAWLVRIGAFVSKVLSEAVDDEYIEMNPANKVRYPGEEERQNRTLAPEEAVRLLNPTDRTGAMALVAAHTGLRRGELCGLKWEDLKDGYLHVRRSISSVRGGDLETKVKTRTSMSSVPLTPEAQAAIEAQPRRSEYVFSTESGKAVSPSNLSRDWRVWRKANKLDPATRLHDLRGSFVSLLIESGADIRTVQELARHADPRTTMKAYARSRKPVKELAVRNLRQVLTVGNGENDAEYAKMDKR